VLIADDDRFFAEMLRTALSDQTEFEVVGIAGDGYAAIELARTLEPTLVLMDADMPALDGFEATRLIRELPAPPTVVFISAADPGQADDRALHAGASAYFKKTGDLASLMSFIGVWADAHAHLT
jgi:DNA-binding NarL/FixJ family response regulator